MNNGAEAVVRVRLKHRDRSLKELLLTLRWVGGEWNEIRGDRIPGWPGGLNKTSEPFQVRLLTTTEAGKSPVVEENAEAPFLFAPTALNPEHAPQPFADGLAQQLRAAPELGE